MTIITKENYKNLDTSIERLGGKAYGLIRLMHNIEKSGCLSPSFAIIPSTDIQVSWADISGQISETCLSAHPFKPIDSNIELFRCIFESNRNVIVSAYNYHSDHAFKPVLRTSIVLQDSERLSFAGANYTSYPLVVDRDEFLSACTSEGYAGLYKPLTNWYLKRHGINTADRLASLCFMEFVDTIGLGTFIYHKGKRCLLSYESTSGEKSLIDLTDNRSLTANEREIVYRLEALTSRADFYESLVGPSFEAEFRLSPQGSIYLTQLRSAPSASVPMLASTTPFNMVDLTGTNKGTLALTEEQIDSNTLWIVNHRDKSLTDAFDLLAFAQEKYGRRDIALRSLKASPNDFDHLVTALEEDPYLTHLEFGVRQDRAPSFSKANEEIVPHEPLLKGGNGHKIPRND